MMSNEMQFIKAERRKKKARIAIDGPTGSGKTYTALVAASVFANGGKIAVIDTESGSASLYSDLFEFDVLELENFDPRIYIKAITVAENAGYDVIVVDSLSHAWEGEGGALDLADKFSKKYQNNTFAAWKDVTPIQRSLIDKMIRSQCHIIATMRTKTEWVIEQDERGKHKPRRIGTSPVQRQGVEYEFDIMADMDIDNNLVITKTRYSGFCGEVVNKPTAEFFIPLREWLISGKDNVIDKINQKGNVNNRPFEPETLKRKLETTAASHGKKTATDKQRSLVAMLLGQIFPDVEERHELQFFLFNHESLNDVEDSMILAVLDWLEPQQDSGGAYYASETAEREARMAHTEALRVAGQMDLL
jgi:hypothetical protein